MDIEIVDTSSSKNVYLSKKGIEDETRLAITTHAGGEVGVCSKDYVKRDVSSDQASKLTRIADLYVDIGADAMNYDANANQKSLSSLETEMRKIEGS
ncbi:hypothetical protein H1R20_g13942, partial [Candolleomyces eurysporus]